MKILDAKFVQDFIKMADDGYQQGWHERNGGNLSYRIKPEEVEIIRNRLDEKGEWIPIGVSVPDLAGNFSWLREPENTSEISLWTPRPA